MKATYDFNHMLPNPYIRIAMTAQNPRFFSAGEAVFQQGDRSWGPYVVVTGCVHLERVGPNGERIVIHRARSGDSFAEASVFSERYHCDAMMIETGELIRFDKTAVLAAFSDPEFAQEYGRHTSHLIQAQRQVLEVVGIRSAEDRVMAGLVAGMLEGAVVNFASKLNLSHEATYRALRNLVQQGRVRNPSRGVYTLAE